MRSEHRSREHLGRCFLSSPVCFQLLFWGSRVIFVLCLKKLLQLFSIFPCRATHGLPLKMLVWGCFSQGLSAVAKVLVVFRTQQETQLLPLRSSSLSSQLSSSTLLAGQLQASWVLDRDHSLGSQSTEVIDELFNYWSL